MKNETFGNRIKTLRLKKGLTQVQLAEELNVDKSTIAKYGTDKIVPSFSVLKKYIKRFDVKLDYFEDLLDDE